ncbi:MAG: AAA family ATPase [Candidatus Calescibacterium sp.]|nr:AAA family ATPase [Candidatus Calescibacterium sp.]MCX7734194.1 AAA family ATPase [bacterium]MDW8086544.1 AAA family ATPase [Candidatus Calescibacterium sp.]
MIFKNFYQFFRERQIYSVDLKRLYPNTYKVFERMVQNQEIRNAFLFYGPQGVGKIDFALHFAKSFLCGLMPPCGFCSECVYESHPDILIVRKSADDERLKVESVRSAIDFALVPPYSSRKFIIIQDAHLMTQQGYSALLKALEESKPYTTYILTASKIELIPSTIVSRCVKVRFFPNIKELLETKIQEKNFPQDVNEILYNISYFNFSVIEKDEETIRRIWKILSCVINPEDSRAEFIKLINEIREIQEARDILDSLESYLVKNSAKLGSFSVDLWEKIRTARRNLEVFINPKIVLLSLVF